MKMEPLTTIVATAIALGAATGLTDTTKQAVLDAYKGLKTLITSRYHVDVTAVENKPASEVKRASLAEDLDDAGAGADTELLTAAQQLLDAIHTLAPETGAVIGVDVAGTQARALEISRIQSTGTGVRVTDSTFQENVTITDVRAGTQEAKDPHAARQ
ncbi:hypothetical protein VMT65_31100 [Nocardia sp. CDC153]|uniref:hypothetical protein n=1 Tax=Nocardia sp. CDC153 TaxID=3112167 RepID=UPI002DBB1D79|nr:hypothetical protein [Nocardia sp. CDC153]MEC3957517.1 hypothetical protein [Nocardia sp. CDC153]